VHAQSEPDLNLLLKAARTGAWVSLDGISSNNIREYIPKLYTLKAAGVLDHVLISHDAGWYKPGEPDGGEFNGFTHICQELLPALKNNGFTQSELDTLLIINPATAFQPSIRAMK
jgi:phosphotriesterase-related protein